MPAARHDSHGLSVHDLPAFLRYGGIRFSAQPSAQQLRNFAEALNDNGHLSYTVNVEELQAAPYVLVATAENGEFVCGCTIKSSDGELAEIGFMLVRKACRRQGLAEYMTALRIAHAWKHGICLLYAKVRDHNTGSMRNLSKAGFQSAGDFLCQQEHRSTISWFYLALRPMSASICRRLLASRITELVPVIP